MSQFKCFLLLALFIYLTFSGESYILAIAISKKRRLRMSSTTSSSVSRNSLAFANRRSYLLSLIHLHQFKHTLGKVAYRYSFKLYCFEASSKPPLQSFSFSSPLQSDQARKFVALLKLKMALRVDNKENKSPYKPPTSPKSIKKLQTDRSTFLT